MKPKPKPKQSEPHKAPTSDNIVIGQIFKEILYLADKIDKLANVQSQMEEAILKMIKIDRNYREFEEDFFKKQHKQIEPPKDKFSPPNEKD